MRLLRHLRAPLGQIGRAMPRRQTPEDLFRDEILVNYKRLLNVYAYSCFLAARITGMKSDSL